MSESRRLTLTEFFNEIKDQWNPSDDLSYIEHIDEHSDEIIKVLKDDKNYNIIAPMNSGKTFSIIKIARENNIKIIMMMPLQMLVIQKWKEFHDEEKEH